MKFSIDEYKAAVKAGRLNDLKALGSIDVTDADGNAVDVETIEVPAPAAAAAVEKARRR
jgi:hypothetical protein